METPELGAIGTYILTSPFTMDEGAIGKTLAVDSFEALAFREIDVYATHYEPYGLTEAKYTEDLDNGVRIVTIVDIGTQVATFVPSSFIDSFPQKGEIIPYSDLVLAMDLGLVPESLDISSLIAELALLVETRLGITTTPKLLIKEVLGGLDYTDSVALELARAARIVRSPTTLGTVSILNQRIAEQAITINLLEEALKEHIE